MAVDTGPLENAQQCEGIVYANDVGLSAISMNGTASVDLEWTSMASYARVERAAWSSRRDRHPSVSSPWRSHPTMTR